MNSRSHVGDREFTGAGVSETRIRSATVPLQEQDIIVSTSAEVGSVRSNSTQYPAGRDEDVPTGLPAGLIPGDQVNLPAPRRS